MATTTGFIDYTEQAAPANPSASHQRLFVRSSDHLLCLVDSSGTVTALATGSPSGSITSSGYTQNTARLLGRTTASAGAIEEITVGTGLSLSAGSLTATGGGDVVRLADTVLGSDTANFDLTSISGSYKHLRLELALRSDRAAQTNDTIKLLINNDTGTNYDYIQGAFGSGSSIPGYLTEAVTQNQGQIGQTSAASSPAGAIAVLTVTFYDYASTTLHKHWSMTGFVLMNNTSANLRIQHGGGRWAATTAISRLTVAPLNGSNWKTGSRATLYGLG